MLAALNRPEELAGHIRGAITNGVTAQEIQECLLQVAVYVGTPAGLGSFRVAPGPGGDRRAVAVRLSVQATSVEVVTETPGSLKDTLQRYLRKERDALLATLDGLDERQVRWPCTPSGTNLLGI